MSTYSKLQSIAIDAVEGDWVVLGQQPDQPIQLIQVCGTPCRSRSLDDNYPIRLRA